jgi:hypothetical protein
VVNMLCTFSLLLLLFCFVFVVVVVVVVFFIVHRYRRHRCYRCSSQQYSWFSKEFASTNPVCLIHSYATTFLTIQHVLRDTAFCLRTYRTGWRSISFKLLCNLFENISILESTSSINIGCFHLQYSY